MIWTTSAADEFRRLFQGISTGSQNEKRAQGTNEFFFIKHPQALQHKVKDITCARIVCTIRSMKEN